MTIEEAVKSVSPTITRAKLTPAGLVIEMNAIGRDKDFVKNVFDQVSQRAWEEDKEIVYSFYKFASSEERFSVEAILREQRTEFSFNMSTSTLGANDIFCRFTRFDFDVLTLANRDEKTIGLFTIDASSPCHKPIIAYKELDIQGHQFPISAHAKIHDPNSGVYEIALLASELHW